MLHFRMGFLVTKPAFFAPFSYRLFFKENLPATLFISVMKLNKCKFFLTARCISTQHT